ncbi:MAG: phosphoglycerate kinase [bacterium]|nr:phosphoglycerate kinase [bacterium]
MLPSLKKITDLNGKKVILRADVNVPIVDGEVAVGADWRIRAILPTLNYLSDAGAKIIIIAHLGRPKGHDMHFSLYSVFSRLKELWHKDKIFFSTEVIGKETENKIAKLNEGEVLMLENLRFHKEEESNEENFSKKLASYGEIFVNDAFADSHRAHASIVGLPKFLKSYAGFLLEKEVSILGMIRAKPRHPLVFIMGGAKADTKLKLIKEFLNKSEAILLGGILANTVLNAKGLSVGQSLVEEKLLTEAKRISSASNNLFLPTDVSVTESLARAKNIATRKIKDVKPEEFVVDIGPETIFSFKKIIKTAKMIVWNGPVGYVELPDFRKGSLEIAKAVAENSGEKIIGGGDLIGFLAEEGLTDKMTYISTGGGAMLEFLAGDELPGIKVLESQSK